MATGDEIYEEYLKLIDQQEILLSKLEKIQGMDQHWPLKDVLAKLIEAAEILLKEKDYDGHGWELIDTCIEKGKEYKAFLTESNED